MEDLPIDDKDCKGEEAMEEAGFEPHLGMDFPSRQAAYDFYNEYGYLLGFSIRKNSYYKSTKGVITSLRMVCSKQGLKKSQKLQIDGSREIGVVSNERTPEKQVSDQRCGCNAAYHVKLHEDGVWRITGLHKDHNHPFVRNTPSKKRHLRSHKQISMEDRADIELLSEHNIGATQIREILGSKAEGKVNLCYSKKDVSNQIISGKRNLVGVDVNAMVDYFMRKQQEDVNAKKMQTCSYCHKKEGHNMRACPKKNKDRARDSKAHEHEEDNDDNFQNSSEYEIDEDNLF